MARQSSKERHRKKRQEKRRERLRSDVREQAAFYSVLAAERLYAGDFRDCVRCAEKAVRIYPDCIDARRILVDALMNLGDFPVAETHARVLLRTVPDPAAFYAAAVALKRQRKWDEAISMYEKAQEHLPRRRDWRTRSRCSAIKESLKECRSFLKQENRPREMSAHFESPAEGREPAPPPKPRRSGSRAEARRHEEHAPEAAIIFHLDVSDVRGLLESGSFDTLDSYSRNVEAHQVLFVAGYDDLLALNATANVRRLEYQAETARRVLRQFRGRALLCDEVGLGQTPPREDEARPSS